MANLFNKSNLICESFAIKRFRSIMDLSIDMDFNKPLTICGENNVGKTNLLRALNIFFNHSENNKIYNPETDIPYHVFKGSRGGRANTDLMAVFNVNGKKHKIIRRFYQDGSDEFIKISKSEAVQTISKFKYLFIESNNINIPELVGNLLGDNVFSTLDTKRSKQTSAMKKLEEFIKCSRLAINSIEKDLNVIFKSFMDFNKILGDKKVKIKFTEFEKLRDVIKGMTDITLSDGNDYALNSKGSGAQRALFMSIMQYIARTSKKIVIWGIDEPEVFLQSKLQKRVFNIFNNITSEYKQTIILTTHSQHFISLDNIDSVLLFEANYQTKEYQRRKGQKFYEMSTVVNKSNRLEKVNLIKECLGISNNDGWVLLPTNLMVEGKSDFEYLKVLVNRLQIISPNIIDAGSSTTIGSLLNFYNNFAKDLTYKPKIHCLFDYDESGRESARKVKKYDKLVVDVLTYPDKDGNTFNIDVSPKKSYDIEIEDFVPDESIFYACNEVMKKRGYKKLSDSQIKNKNKTANKNDQILKYLTNICASNNPEKQKIDFEDRSIKYEICRYACKYLENEENEIIFPEYKINFLKSLI